MAQTIVLETSISPAVRARIQACGHAIILVSSSGAHVAARWSCGSSWCKRCASTKRERARCAIAARIDVHQPQLVTLTIPHRRRLDAAYLREQVQRTSSMWRGVQSRLRWHRHRRRRGDALASEQIPPPGRGAPHPEFASTWRGQWATTCDAGVWVREITQGSAAHRGWHVHLHVIVRSRADAELLNAAWQEEAERRGARGWFKTDIRPFDGAAAARYVAKYLTKADIKAVPERDHCAYVEGTRGMRRCDSWGDWRPLGIGAREESSVTHAARVGWEYAAPVAEYYGHGTHSTWLRTGVPPDWLLAEHPELSWLAHGSPEPEALQMSRRAAILHYAREYPERVRGSPTMAPNPVS